MSSATTMDLKSPAYGVPPEPPFKKQKVVDDKTSSHAPAPDFPAEPLADLAEQLDIQERRKYIKGKELGRGTYADVFLATLRSDPSKKFAIKKIRIAAEQDRVGISYDTIREVRCLQELDHPNIIKLYSVFSTKDQNLNLVLENLPRGDLKQLYLDTSIRISPADIKAWMLMMMRGMWFCHANFVLHRDIKPDNILIAANGEVKIADFGLARTFVDPGQRRAMTHEVITLWYRPLELLYKAPYYGGAVDIWSCACVFAELVIRDAFLPAAVENSLSQIQKICETLGSPTEDNWPGVSKLPDYVAPEEVTPLRPKEFWLTRFRTLGEQGADLLMKMMALDPNQRLTAEGTLRHPYWTSAPRPTSLENLPKKGGGIEKMGEDLSRRGGELPRQGNGVKKEGGRVDGVARKINFGGMK